MDFSDKILDELFLQWLSIPSTEHFIQHALKSIQHCHTATSSNASTGSSSTLPAPSIASNDHSPNSESHRHYLSALAPAHAHALPHYQHAHMIASTIIPTAVVTEGHDVAIHSPRRSQTGYSAVFADSSLERESRRSSRSETSSFDIPSNVLPLNDAVKDVKDYEGTKSQHPHLTPTHSNVGYLISPVQNTASSASVLHTHDALARNTAQSDDCMPKEHTIIEHNDAGQLQIELYQQQSSHSRNSDHSVSVTADNDDKTSMYLQSNFEPNIVTTSTADVNRSTYSIEPNSSTSFQRKRRADDGVDDIASASYPSHATAVGFRVVSSNVSASNHSTPPSAAPRSPTSTSPLLRSLPSAPVRAITSLELSTTNVTKTSFEQLSYDIKQFYYVNGVPPTPLQAQQDLSLIQRIFFKLSLSEEVCSKCQSSRCSCIMYDDANGPKALTLLGATSSLTREEFFPLTQKLCGLSSYCNTALYCAALQFARRLRSDPSGKLSYQTIELNSSIDTECNLVNDLSWSQNELKSSSITMAEFIEFYQSVLQRVDATTKLFRLLNVGSCHRWLTRASFQPIITDVVARHPGLEFLEATPEFQVKYAQTVVARIFYTVNTSGNERLTLAELKRSNFMSVLSSLDTEEDINKLNDYFSYEHFYVIYCFSEDTRLLTDQGFLFVDQIRTRLSELRFACYNPQARQLQYFPARAFFCKPRGHQRMVHFANWDDKSYCFSSSSQPAYSLQGFPSMLVTEDHEMYVRLLFEREKQSSGAHFTNSTISCYTKQKARSLLPHVTFTDARVAFLTKAENGVVMVTGPNPLLHILKLTSQEQVFAFLKLYGFWLGRGALSCGSSAGCYASIVFQPRNRADAQWIFDLLCCATSFTPTQMRSYTKVRRSSSMHMSYPLWCTFFAEEYGERSILSPTSEVLDGVLRIKTWLFPWVLTHLDCTHLQLIFDGLHRASRSGNENCIDQAVHWIDTDCLRVREQLLQACVHAGYSVSFSLLPGTKISPHPSYIRDLSLQHTDLTYCFQHRSPASTQKQHIWRIRYSDEPEYVLDSKAGVRSVEDYVGRVWCVEVPYGLVVAQRAWIDASATVLHASQPIIVGNCKFWELDSDHDGLIDVNDLISYDDYALTSRVVDRIVGGFGRPLLSGEVGKLNYSDFVIFLINEVDKTNAVSLEYWFRCLDLDGDGVLNAFEMDYFFDEQKMRIQALSQEQISFTDIFCQLVDMIKNQGGLITTSALETGGDVNAHLQHFEKALQPSPTFSRADFKQSKLAGAFFNTLINLQKFILSDQRDPLRIKQVHDTPQLSDWDRYAISGYGRLSFESENDHDEEQAAETDSGEEEDHEHISDMERILPHLHENGMDIS